MFNGIIYNQGTVAKIIKRPKGLNIFVKSNLKVSNKDMGLSVLKKNYRNRFNLKLFLGNDKITLYKN